MTLKTFSIAALFALSLTWINPASAADPAAPDGAMVVNTQFQIAPVSDEWRTSLPRDADAATKAYLDRLSPAVVTRANNYFEGGYW